MRGFGALAIASLACLPASAQSPAQTKTIENLAMAFATEQTCSSVEVSPVVMAASLLLVGLRAADVGQGGRYMPLLMSRASEASRVLAKQGPAVACGVGRSLFGEHGVNVRGLLVDR